MKAKEKLTAVEWFYFEMENLRVKAEITNMDGNDFIIAKVKLLQQAKEMEKEYEQKVNLLLDTLLENNMCSVVGDELIQTFKSE